MPASATAGESARAGQSAYQGGGTTLTPLPAEWWFTSWKILPKVWPLTQGAGVTVAVLDSGVQASVPDLRGVVVPGGDVTGNRTDGETDFAADGHGTAMAVLIAGQGYGTGMVGVAPKAKILPVTVTASSTDLTADPGRVAAGIMYAATHGAQVIDISQVYPSASAASCDPALQAAVGYALARNIVVVAAEGSGYIIGDRPSEPASCAGVLSVGALVHTHSTLWPGDVAEPYLTVVAVGDPLISSGADGRLVTDVSGARSASALVAGVVALIRSRYPAMPWYQVIQRIIGTALPEGGRVPNDSWGFGIVRMSEVVNATAFPVAASTPNPVYARYLAWLATPQGRSVSRQAAAATAAAAPRRPGAATAGAGKPASRGYTSAILGLLLALAAIAALFAAALTRSPKQRRRRTPGTRATSAFRPPVPIIEELPAEEAPQARIYFGADNDEESRYRIPPYAPAAVRRAAGIADIPPGMAPGADG